MRSEHGKTTVVVTQGSDCLWQILSSSCAHGNAFPQHRGVQAASSRRRRHASTRITIRIKTYTANTKKFGTGLREDQFSQAKEFLV